MKIKYLYYKLPSGFEGVERKVDGQLSAFKDYGFEVEKIGLSGGYLSRFLFSFVEAYKSNYDVIYIRNLGVYFISVYFSLVLKKARRIVVLEFPTPVYSLFFELKNNTNRCFLHWLKRRLLKIAIDLAARRANFIVQYAEDLYFPKASGAPKNLLISNGYDVEYPDIVKEISDGNRVYVLMVARFAFWHGADRFLYSLRSYYDSKKTSECNVILDIVGAGGEIQKLKDIVKELRMEDFVVFHGILDRNQIYNLAGNALFALGSLANHRKNMFQESSLKAREYCAMGVPFLLTTKDDGFGDGLNFVRYDDSSEELMDIAEHVNYFSSLNREKISAAMKIYAREKLSWRSQIFPVIEELHLISKKIKNN